MQDLTALLRTSVVVRELGEKCPSFSRTRWLFIFDILIWMYRRKEKIDAFLLASENNRTEMICLPDEWREFLLVLTPLKKLNLVMESPNFALWEVIPIVGKVLESWRELIPRVAEPVRDIMKHMAANLFTRFSHASSETVIAAYSLSEMGRMTLRRREEGFQTKGSNQERLELFDKLFSSSWEN